MNKLSVGRIVHYFPDGDEANPLAAIVTKVWSDTCCNLFVFSCGTEGRIAGSTCGAVKTSVCLRNDENRVGVWDWPARV